MFAFGIYSYNAATGSTPGTTNRISNKTYLSAVTTPLWFWAGDTVGNLNSGIGVNEWLDITCYLLGDKVDASRCPDLRVNGSTDNDDNYNIFIDGLQTRTTTPWVEFRFLNYNTSPNYGNGVTTAVYFTDFTVQRIDSPAEFQAVLQEEISVTTDSIDGINATYAVRAQLTTDPDGNSAPYVFGFGLMGDVVLGTPTSAFGIQADKFFVTNPGNSTDNAFPFVVDVVDGSSTVGIQGELIVDGSIRAGSLTAKTIGAGYLNVLTLDTVAADMGIIGAGLLTTSVVTDGYYDPPDNQIPKYATDESAFRVEIEGGSSWPIWYGSGEKAASSGLFYVTTDGSVVVKGLLDAGIIKQSYFTPADANNSFRIACDYPANYSGGLYTGKKAHLFPIKQVNFLDESNQGTVLSATGITTSSVTFYSPSYSGNQEYGRLGTYSENFIVFMSGTYVGGSYTAARLELEYQYDAEGWKDAFYTYGRCNDATGLSHTTVFISRNTPTWSTLQFRLRSKRPTTLTGGQTADNVWCRAMSLCLMPPNFGYADIAASTATGAVEIGTASGGTAGSGRLFN
jgi:hypothetical protein